MNRLRRIIASNWNSIKAHFSGTKWLKWSAITVGGIAVVAAIIFGLFWYLIVNSHGIVVVTDIKPPSAKLEKIKIDVSFNSDKLQSEWSCNSSGYFIPIFPAPGSNNISPAVFGKFSIMPKLKGYTSQGGVVSCLDFLKNPPPTLVLTPEIPPPITAIDDENFELQPGVRALLSTNMASFTDRENSIKVFCVPETNPTCEWSNHENQAHDPERFTGDHHIINNSGAPRTYNIVARYKLGAPTGPRVAIGGDTFEISTISVKTTNQIVQFTIGDGINKFFLNVSPE